MKSLLRKRDGQVVIEYMLLVAMGVIVIILATKAFNEKVMNSISQGISGQVSKQCAGCNR